MTVGYSGTPLAKKLGIKEGSKLLLIEAPENYPSLVQPLPDAVTFANHASPAIDLVHLFATRKNDLEKHLAFQVRIHWQPDTLLFWDNWATQHHAIWDYYPFERWGERVSAFVGHGPQGVAANASE